MDAGGIFKEFLNNLCKTAFDPNYGFFVQTEFQKELYPNPITTKDLM